MSGFTKGPWYPVKNSVDQWEVMTLRDADILSENWRDSIGCAYGASICMGIGDHTESRTSGNEEANARLIAAAPELYEALKQTIALAWQDTREVKFDSTVLFGLGYDFDGWELFRSEIHTPAGSWAVWSSNGKYSAYGGPDGGMWFEKFDTSEAAEEAVLREIDRLCPSFPTAVARAALSKAAGEGV